jgi:hypothetical protein
VTLAQDSATMQCEEAHFSNVLPFPSALRSFVIEAFAASYETIKSGYGFGGLFDASLVSIWDSFGRTQEGWFSFIEFQFTREEVFHIKHGIDLPVTLG